MHSLLSISIFLIALASLTFLSKPLYQGIIKQGLAENTVTVSSNHVAVADHDHLRETTTPNIEPTANGILHTPLKTNMPHFAIAVNSRKNTLSIIGEIASENEKQQLIETLCEASTEFPYNQISTDELIVNNELTTIRNRDLLFESCGYYLCKAQSASLEWTPMQTKLAGEMTTEQAILETIREFENLSTDDDEVISNNLNLIKAPSLDFTLERLSNNKIILHGTLPNKEMGDAIYQLVASSHTASIGVNEKTYVANNFSYTDQDLEVWWLGIPERFIGDFLKQTEGIAKIEYTKDGLYIEGIYKKQEDYFKARGSFQSIPKNLDVYDDFLRVKGDKINNTPSASPNKVEDDTSGSYHSKPSNYSNKKS